ncbi:MAG: hypothetical protein ACREME_11845 [Gemmatimonadales bacterium]
MKPGPLGTFTIGRILLLARGVQRAQRRMRPLTIVALSLLGLLVGAGCGASRAGGEKPVRAGVRSEGGHVVLEGAELEEGPGSLLGTLMGKVPGMRVRQPVGQCPQITLRSDVSFRSVHNPHVYVDGARATNTCVLETLRKEDVERVEVYPQGFTQRPGYGTHSGGLILVFLRSA